MRLRTASRARLSASMADGERRIVNISLIIASTDYDGLSVFGATKAAATGFTWSLARDVAKLGSPVNAMAPGCIPPERPRTLDDEGPHSPPAAARCGRKPRRLAHGGIPVE